MLVQSKTLGGPFEETVAIIGLFCNFFYFLLKIKYKFYISILFTSIPFVFASIFKFIVKASLGSKYILFSYFIITEPTELKLSQIASPGNSNAVNFFQKVSYIFSHSMQPSWIECCV